MQLLFERLESLGFGGDATLSKTTVCERKKSLAYIFASMCTVPLKAQKERFVNADTDYKTAQEGLESPYCKRKGIPTFKGVHYHANSTLLPIINIDSKVIAYQKIYRGQMLEQFTKITCGPSKGGLFFIDQQELKTKLPENISDTLLFCEGFSTGASLHLATDYPVMCTISANAIETIVNSAMEKYCTHDDFLGGIICADNDASKKTNVGLKVGRTAAYKSRIKICFPEGDEQSMDFNDVHTTYGLEAVKRTVMNSKRVVMNPSWLTTKDKGYKTYRQRKYARLRGSQ